MAPLVRPISRAMSSSEVASKPRRAKRRVAAVRMASRVRAFRSCWVTRRGTMGLLAFLHTRRYLYTNWYVDSWLWATGRRGKHHDDRDDSSRRAALPRRDHQ